MSEKITDEKDVFVVRTNTDLTEGKGRQYVKYICENRATANRLAKGEGVMGSDAFVAQAKAYKINNQWYYLGEPISPSKEDDAAQIMLDAYEAAKQKALSAGLTDEDIKALMRQANQSR